VEVARTTAAELRQTLVPGDYSYRVTALRESSVQSDGITSEPSQAVALTVKAARGGSSGTVTALGGGKGRGKQYGGRGLGPPSRLGALLSGSSLPNAGGLPPIPSPPGIPWGKYELKLPYGKAADLPSDGRPRLVSASRPGSTTLLPADGLRWVAAGLLLLACAGLALLTAVRDVAIPLLSRGDDS
jgi:hypothetical protein